MAGWVIGLGDRHSSNILLDERTAACVHIDLGVAFEQVGGVRVCWGRCVLDERTAACLHMPAH